VNHVWKTLTLVVSLLFAFVMACDAGVVTSGGAGGVGGNAGTGGISSGGSGGSAAQGGCGLFGCGGSGAAPPTGLVISPQSPVLQVVGGNVPTQDFVVTQNGNDVTSQVSWYYDRPDIGNILPATNTFQPTGLVGGTGKLVAQLGPEQAETDVSVGITKTTNSGNLDPATIAALDAPSGGADPGIQLVYPYDQTVFPLGVLAPEIQWNNTQPADAYKLEIDELFYSYTEYFTAPPPSRHLITEADWANISSSGTGAQSDPVTVKLTRFTNGQAYQPVTQTWKIAQGKLKGALYYWELPDQCGSGNGRVLKIKPDSAVSEEFFFPGGCWGCHTVSRNGKTLMATLDQGVPFPQITADLTQTPAVQGAIGVGVTAGTFSAFNDKGDRIIVSNDGSNNNERLRIFDATNGTLLNDNAMGTNCGEPAWSPDGKKLAAICGLTDNFSWIFDANQGHLATADVAADGFTVSNVVELVQQAGAPGRPAYPSFAPGNEWIAFGRPTYGSRSIADGKLWLVNVDGSGLKELSIASSDNKSFNPVFAPLRAGGYYWLVYISRRDYGNRLVGAGRQQLWITAIDDPPSAVDPSHPPFYVRGQEDCAKSENAYMALDPCKEIGEGCQTGVDCCNGQCVLDPNTNTYVYGQPPPPGECSKDGNSCQTAADCCNPEAICLDGFCQPPIPN